MNLTANFVILSCHHLQKFPGICKICFVRSAKERRFVLIEELVRCNEWATADLARRLGVNLNLLANDLKVLEKMGLVARTRGRVRWIVPSLNNILRQLPFVNKWEEEEEDVADKLAAFIVQHFNISSGVFLDEGVIPTLVAQKIFQTGIEINNIVTINLAIPLIMAYMNLPLPCEILPGRVDSKRLCVLPTSFESYFEKFIPSIAVVTPHAVSPGGDLWAAESFLSKLKRRVAEVAGQVVFVCGAEKIGVSGGFIVANAAEVQKRKNFYLVTEESLKNGPFFEALSAIWGERLLLARTREGGKGARIQRV